MGRQTSNSWDHFGVRGADGVLKALPFRTLKYRQNRYEQEMDFSTIPDDGEPLYSVEWRTLDLERGDTSEALNTMPPEARALGTALACGSRIYVLGGLCPGGCKCPDAKFVVAHIHNCVFYFDSARLGCGWQKAPPMLYPRDSPSAVASGGKIYVFGFGFGLFTDATGLFAEVFNVELNRWDKLPAPPVASDLVPVSVSRPVLFDSSRSRILVHFSSNNSLHAFRTDCGSWECLDPEFGTWSDASVMVGDVAYFFFDLGLDWAEKCITSFRAYDVVDKKWFPVKWLSDPELIAAPFSDLFHLGKGRMCLFSYHYGIGSFQYVKFRVRRKSGEFGAEFSAEAEPESTITVPSQDCLSRIMMI